MFIFNAEIYSMPAYEGIVLEWDGYFTTPQKAEAAIAIEQAKIAPEDAWADNHVQVNGLDTYACISKIEVL